jgi:hypothetical protein
LSLLVILGIVTSIGIAQQKKDKTVDVPKDKASSSVADGIVARMMAFDANKDGKLTRKEITDERLLRLFDRADTNKDGVVTKEELSALAKRMAEEAGNGGRGGFGPGGGFGPPGGPGGPGGRGPGGFGGPPQPGQIMLPFLQQALKLTAKQKKQLAELQKEVDGKLSKILTDEQKKQLKDMREGFRRGPGGPPPGSPGGEGDRPPRP